MALSVCLLRAQRIISGDAKALADVDVAKISRFVWAVQVTNDGNLSSWLAGSDAPYPDDFQGLKLVSSGFPPTAVVVADADTLLPPNQSRDLARAIRGCGVEAVAFTCKGMQHGEAEALVNSPPWPKDNDWWESALRPSLEFALRKMME